MIHNTRPGMGTIDWGTLLSSGTKIAEGVLIPRFGNPPPGTTRTTDPKSGATNISTYPGGGISGDLSGGTLALIAVVLIGGVVLVSSRGK